VSHLRILRGVAEEYRARSLCHPAAPEREVFFIASRSGSLTEVTEFAEPAHRPALTLGMCAQARAQ
jgi:hypothetical protein